MDPPQDEPTKQTTSIDDLPPEMISRLFEYLPPKDLAPCSLVNKHWHSIYVAFKLHSLVATDYDEKHLFGIKKWYHTNRPFREAERCRPAMFGRLVEKPLLSNLKQLALCGYKFEFDLNKLNRFKQLVHLEIRISLSKMKVHLNLPRLEVLAFDCMDDHCQLSVDCPLLSTLAYSVWDGNVNPLEVKHPETIRKLETDSPDLAQFKGVECLVTDRFEAISEATLLALLKLKELHYNRSIKSFFWIEFPNRRNNGGSTVDRMRQTLSKFLNEAKKLKAKKLRSSDLQFSFCGFQLTNVKPDQIDFGVQVDEKSREERVCDEYVYMRNYDLIEPGALHFVDQVNYSLLLLNSVIGEFPRCFFQKFTRIEYVKATAQVQDTDEFLWFLRSLRSLRRLELANTGLGQEFYDQLPASADAMLRLELGHGHCENELQLNFDFIGKFSGLSRLVVLPALSVQSLTSLIRWLSGLVGCTFFVQSSTNRKSFRIAKEIDSLWTIHESNPWTLGKPQMLFENENPEEIVHFFNRFQSDTD